MNYRKLVDELVEASAKPSTPTPLALLFIRTADALDDLLLMLEEVESDLHDERGVGEYRPRFLDDEQTRGYGH